MNFNIDIAIVIGFLIFNLGVGLYFGRNVQNIKDYALGGRNFSTATLSAAIIATWVGGDNFSLYLSESYTEGLYFILSSFAALAAFLIIGYIYAPRMQEFLGDLTIAESMGKLYGQKVRIITSIFGFIVIASLVSMQFKISATLLSHLLGSSGLYTTIVSAGIVILYSSFGGIRSVTFTDIVQFFTFGTIVPVIALIVWSGIDDVEIIANTVQNNSLFDIGLLLDYETPRFWSFLTLMLLFLIPGFDPSIFQRISMSKDPKQLKKAFTNAAIAVLVVQLLISWISILILSKDSSLSSENLFGYILDNYSYPGLKALFVIGIMTMVMSTADSSLNSGAVMFSHDIALSMNLIKPKYELVVSRLASIFLGLIALFMALWFDNLFDLFIFGYSFYMPVVTVPFTLAVLGFRTSGRTALIAMTCGFFASLGWMYLDTEVDSVIPGLLVNLIVMLSYHYFCNQPGGWKKQLPTSNTEKKTTILTLKRFNFFNSCESNLPRNETSYILFAIFSIVLTLSISHTIPIDSESQYSELIYILYFLTLFVAVFFLVLPLWLKKLKDRSFIAVLWFLGLFFTLSFTPSLFVIISKFGHFQLMMFLVSTVVLSMLSRWQFALSIMIFGVCGSFIFFNKYAGVDNAHMDLSKIEFKIIYVIVLISSVLIAFFKPKQEYIEATEERVGTLETEVADLNEKVVHYTERVEDQSREIERLGATAQRILNNVNHELRLPVGNVMNFAEMLNDGLGKFNEEQLKDLSDEVYKNSNRLSSMILNMLDLATLDARKIELNKIMINFGELVRDRVQLCRKIYLEDKKIDFEMQIEDNIFISVDPNYMRQTVDNLVINAINFSTEGVIRISVLRKGNVIEFMISDNGIGIQKEDLYDIFTPFKMGSNAESKAEGRGVGLALCKAAVEAHGGSISAESKGGVGAQFRFVL